MESLLIVDDDVNLCSVLKEELTEVGYVVDSVTNVPDAFEFIDKKHVDLLLLDLKMPKQTGFDILEKLESYNKNIKVIILTAYADVKSAINTALMGANDFISKPYDFDELLITIRNVLQRDV